MAVSSINCCYELRMTLRPLRKLVMVAASLFERMQIVMVCMVGMLRMAGVRYRLLLKNENIN